MVLVNGQFVTMSILYSSVYRTPLRLSLPLWTLSSISGWLWESSRDAGRTCLCLGSLLQMTNTVPCLLTNEHPSQYFLIALRTFIPLIPITLVVPVTPVTEDDTRSGEEWLQMGVHR